ncbi:MAG: 30S ribosomal protein S1 [Bacteroidetes bacterium ADurb.Bin174]|nr:MAG: 30S ribosomal protein S1 [Bacteroidetes bacterium ADurb.Bin174]
MKENQDPALEPQQTTPEEVKAVDKKVEAEKAKVTTPVEKKKEVKEVKEVKEEAKPVEVIEEASSKATEKVEEPAQEKEFDWDAYEKDDFRDATAKEELKKIYDNTLTAIKDKEVVDGTVISISKREVVVNVGYKSDGIVPMSEFRYNPDLKVGDIVEVYIESQEDKKGQLILSHKQARMTRAWDRINEALDTQEIVKGYVKCRTKGGMIVDVFGIEAFLPGSQIDVKPIRDYDVFVNKTMEFKVIKINHEFKNVVVSHKALIEAELENQKKEIISKLQKGQILEGIVKNITSYGVFIDLGGIDGLIHITDLSWGRVSHPEEIVSLDEKINVVILDFDDEKKRIALGLKQLSAHPWDALDPNLQVGDKIKGKVVVMADYGAFVEIAPGVEGLIHVSEMSWSQHLRSAQDFLKVGDEVETVILTLDREERKMSLGIKQLKADPWDTIEEKYAVGTKHTAKVRNFTNFGVFAEIEEGVDGLIHISDLSWTKKIKHPSEFTQIGSEIEVQVLEIDLANRRLSLGHKQIEENPWDTLETLFVVDSIHEGTIIEMMDKGSVISLPYGVEGFATPKHLIKEDGSQAQLDEKLPFKVIEFNKDAKRIILSHSRIHEDEKRAEKAATGAPAKKTGKRTKKEDATIPAANIEKTTLGDIQSLADLKDQMETAAVEKAKKAAKTKATKTEATEKAEVAEKAETTKKAEATEKTGKVAEEKTKKTVEKPAKAVAEEKPAEAPAEKEAKAEKKAKATTKKTEQPVEEKVEAKKAKAEKAPAKKAEKAEKAEEKTTKKAPAKKTTTKKTEEKEDTAKA